MATQGPDEEEWRRMSPLAKRIYWLCVALVFGLVAYLFFKA